MMRGNGNIDFDMMPARHGIARNSQQWDVTMIVGLVVRLALVALFVWAVVMVVKYLVRYLNVKSGIDTDSAEEIARKRFASGELTKAEFEQLKKDLK